MANHPGMTRLLTAVLLGIGAVALGVNASGGRRFPTRTVESDIFEFDPDSGTILWKETGDSEPFFLTIHGMVEETVKLGYRELVGLPATTQVVDFHCVEGWTIPDVSWTGLRFEVLLALVTPLPGADYVTFHALGETRAKPMDQGWYRESFRLSDLLDPGQRILLASHMDGEPLSKQRGAPLRVIAPLRLAYKSIKFVHRIEFTDTMNPGWWTLANPVYDIDANVPSPRLRPRPGTDDA
ncbi:MAG: molybdopterin-dependent oxidoreductase [Thermodesulfobacteriota bacterium]